MLSYHANHVIDIIMAAHIHAEIAHIQQGDRCFHFSSYPGKCSIED